MLLKRNGYLEHIRKFYDSNLIKVLTGVRRCGKSILLDQIRDELLEEGKVKEDHLIYINFEDISFSKLKNAQKLNAYIFKRIKDKDKYYIFLDEIQNVRSFEKALASLKATQNVSIFVTGSNSKLLSGRLASLLVGRCKEFRIMPFTYSEFVEYHNQNLIPLPPRPFQNYLRYGGFPQRLDYEDEEDIKSYLDSIYYGIVEKDICSKKSKINRDTFLTISGYIISNSGKEFSPASVVDNYNRGNSDAIYNNTIYRYLKKLEEACLISRVKRYDVASKRTLKKVEKQFVVDGGFLLSTSPSGSLSVSHALENLVYNELVYRGYDVKIGKTYKGEIDFVAMKNGKKCFIQVAYLLSSKEVIEREFGAFASIKDASPKYVLSLDEYDLSKDGIVHLNIEDWLLGKAEMMP